MKRLFRQIIVVLTLTVLAPLLVYCERNFKEPGYEVRMLTDMVRPVPYEAYSENSVLPDGMTLQPPPAGTIYRGALDERPEFSVAALERGKFVFENYCLICHGVKGDGDGPLIPKFPNPPAFDSRRVKGLTSGRIFQVITRGKGEMPAYAAQIGPADRWRAVYYVETLQGKRGNP